MKKTTKNVSHQREITLEDNEAEAAGPIEGSVAGEEDPGSALEELVEHAKKDENKRKRQP